MIFIGTYPMLSGMHDFAANKLGPTQPTLVSGCEVLDRPDDWPTEISAIRRRQDSRIFNADLSTSLVEKKGLLGFVSQKPLAPLTQVDVERRRHVFASTLPLQTLQLVHGAIKLPV